MAWRFSNARRSSSSTSVHSGFGFGRSAACVASSVARASDRASREYLRIEERAKLEPFLAAEFQASAPRIDGAEAELRSALNADDHVIPWPLLISPADRHEIRQDATGATPAIIGAMQKPIIRRVFRGSAMGFLGINFTQVGVRDSLAYVLSAGVCAARRRTRTSSSASGAWIPTP